MTVLELLLLCAQHLRDHPDGTIDEVLVSDGDQLTKDELKCTPIVGNTVLHWQSRPTSRPRNSIVLMIKP